MALLAYFDYHRILWYDVYLRLFHLDSHFFNEG